MGIHALGRGAAKKIGLVWSGNKAHKNDHNQSTDLKTLEPLFFVAIQVAFASKI